MEPSVKAIFLDRDGTLNRNTQYLIDFEQFELIAGVVPALHILKNLGFKFFIVSNQSGVARGLFTYADVERLHLKIAAHMDALGIHFEEFAFCPHHPQGKVPEFTQVCECRKPKPGMLRYLVGKHGIDLSESLMVGDMEHDAQTGINAGCRGVWIRPTGVQRPNALLDKAENIKEFVSLLDFAESLRDAMGITHPVDGKIR